MVYQVTGLGPGKYGYTLHFRVLLIKFREFVKFNLKANISGRNDSIVDFDTFPKSHKIAKYRERDIWGIYSIRLDISSGWV